MKAHLKYKLKFSQTFKIMHTFLFDCLRLYKEPKVFDIKDFTYTQKDLLVVLQAFEQDFVETELEAILYDYNSEFSLLNYFEILSGCKGHILLKNVLTVYNTIKDYVIKATKTTNYLTNFPRAYFTQFCLLVYVMTTKINETSPTKDFKPQFLISLSEFVYKDAPEQQQQTNYIIEL